MVIGTLQPGIDTETGRDAGLILDIHAFGDFGVFVGESIEFWIVAAAFPAVEGVSNGGLELLEVDVPGED